MAKEKTEKQPNLSGESQEQSSADQESSFAHLDTEVKKTFATHVAVERDSPLDVPSPSVLAYVRIRRTLNKGACALAGGDLATAVESIMTSIDQLRSVDAIDTQSKQTYAVRALATARHIITTY